MEQAQMLWLLSIEFNVWHLKIRLNSELMKIINGQWEWIQHMAPFCYHLTLASHPSCSTELPPQQSLWVLCRPLSGNMFWETSLLQWALLWGLCVWSWLRPECWQVCKENFMWLQRHQRTVLWGTQGRMCVLDTFLRLCLLTSFTL